MALENSGMGVRRHGRGWALATFLALGAEAAAQSPADGVIEQLREQGYVEFEVSRTLLRRVRVVALASDGGWREIVFNPATGEILRDYYEAADGSREPTVLERPDDVAGNGGPGIAGERDADEPSRGVGQGNGGPGIAGERDADEPSRGVGQGNGPPPQNADNRPGGAGEAGSRGPGQASGAGRAVGP